MKAGKGLIIVTAGVVFFTIFSGLSIGAVLEVGPGKPYATIQSAIDAAAEGDTVLAADGTYTGEGNRDISFHGKAITVVSENGPQSCIIDCQGSFDNIHRGFVFVSGESRDSVLEGFTIFDGLHMEYLAGDYFGYGGGIYINDNSSPVIRNCILKKNEVFFDGLGGAYGGGIYVGSNSNPLIENCLFLDNHAPSDSDGLCGHYYSNPEVRNCTFIRNSVRLDEEGQILSSIFFDFGGIFLTHPGKASIMYSCFYGADGSNGNIDTDPLFADLAGDDYHLKSETGRWDSSAQAWVTDAVTSPCIDAGDPGDEDWMEELWPHGKRINMGFYGGTAQASMSPNPVGLLTDVDHDDCTGMADLALLCEDWLLDLPLLDTDLNRDSNVDVTDFSILSGQWGLCGPAVLDVSANEFTFLALEDGNDPNGQILMISNLEGKELFWSIDAPGQPGWLSMNPVGGILASGQSQPVTISVDISGLAAGDYGYSFDVTDPNAVNSPQTVTVDLHIGTLVAYWALDEETGTTAYDSSGYGHDGTLVNMDSSDWVGGKIGNCLDFDGTDDYVQTPYILNPASDPFSVFTWVKGGGIGYGAILTQTDDGSGGTGRLWFFVSNSGYLATMLGGVGLSYTDQQWDSTAWHHVGFVWDGACRHLFLDGVEVAGDDENDPIGNLEACEGDLLIGTIKTHAGNFWDGLIDEVRIYDIALSAEQVAALAGELLD